MVHTHNLSPHNFLTHNLLTHNFLTHNLLTHGFLVAHANPSPSLFSFLHFPCHLYLSFAACWKKLTCGVIRPFNLTTWTKQRNQLRNSDCTQNLLPIWKVPSMQWTARKLRAINRLSRRDSAGDQHRTKIELPGWELALTAKSSLLGVIIFWANSIANCGHFDHYCMLRRATFKDNQARCSAFISITPWTLKQETSHDTLNSTTSQTGCYLKNNSGASLEFQLSMIPSCICTEKGCWGIGLLGCLPWESLGETAELVKQRNFRSLRNINSASRIGCICLDL